ncbi:GAF domain-containing protein [Hydrogenophaga defluvii]|uniref:GAF domain-containing protein n=1 Tax=Hydrogenophaga defluvii TaxID=249410 RepID=A0ABW2SIB2_9BURK
MNQPVPDTRKCLEHFACATEMWRREGTGALYREIERAMDDLVGHKLLTILKLEESRLHRMHTSDLARYPVGGYKDITHDRWLTAMLRDGTPIISADADAVRARFYDHETIFALGCGAAMNIPIVGPRGTLGSLNLLHQPGWFAPEHVRVARPFALLLALAWS